MFKLGKENSAKLTTTIFNEAHNLIKIIEHKAKSMPKRQARRNPAVSHYLTAAHRAFQEFNPFLPKMQFRLCQVRVP